MTTDCEVVIEDYHAIMQVPILGQNEALAAAQE